MLQYEFLFLSGILFTIYLQLQMYAKNILAHQIEKSNVLPCVRNPLSYTTYLAQGPRLVTSHWLYRKSRNLVVQRRHKNVRMMSV